MDVRALLLVAVWLAFAGSIPIKHDLQDTYCPQASFVVKRGWRPEVAEVGMSLAGIKCQGAMPSEISLNLRREPKRNFCGVKDVRLQRGLKRVRRYVLRGLQWDKKLITWRLYNFTPKLNPMYTLRAIRKAFKQWEMNSGLTIKQVVTGSADIAISFEPKRHYIVHGLFCHMDFDGPGGTIGHAFYPQKNAAYAGNIHMDGDEDFSTDGSFGFNFESAIMHEIGHSLGLMHVYGYNAIMNPDYAMSAKGVDIQLHLDDIDGIQALYGPPKINKAIKNSMEDNSVEDVEQQKFIEENKRPVQKILEVNDHINEHNDVNQQTYHEHEATIENEIEVPNETEVRAESTAIAKAIKEMTIQREAWKASVLVPKQMPPIQSKGDNDLASYRETVFQSSGLRKAICPDMFDAIYVSSNDLDTYVFSKFYEYSLGPWLGYQGQSKYIRSKFLFPNVDAVYRRINDSKLIVFSGQLYAVYKNDTILEKYGAIYDFGFPYSTKKVDAALTFGRYRNTYFFTGDEYWRYNEKYKSMDAGYPKKISSVWKGVPSNVDTAITWKNGRTYFFKGNKYYRIYTRTATVENGYPKSIKVWTKCHLYSKNAIDS